MMLEEQYFIKNEKYKILQTFISSGNTFVSGEEVIFRGKQFVPYDEVWSYAFCTKQKKNKYLIVKDKTEIDSYSKYFEHR